MGQLYRSTERSLVNPAGKGLVLILLAAAFFISAQFAPLSAVQRMVLAEGYTNYT